MAGIPVAPAGTPALRPRNFIADKSSDSEGFNKNSLKELNSEPGAPG